MASSYWPGATETTGAGSAGGGATGCGRGAILSARPADIFNARLAWLNLSHSLRFDVAILVVGENESTNREAWGEYHLGDRDSLDLLGAQNDLVKSVVETGTPTVVLLINGRPLSINYIAEHVPAILEGWYLGQEGGTAAARVLFGDVNPGGKLPITDRKSTRLNSSHLG